MKRLQRRTYLFYLLQVEVVQHSTVRYTRYFFLHARTEIDQQRHFRLAGAGITDVLIRGAKYFAQAFLGKVCIGFRQFFKPFVNQYFNAGNIVFFVVRFEKQEGQQFLVVLFEAGQPQAKFEELRMRHGLQFLLQFLDRCRLHAAKIRGAERWAYTGSKGYAKNADRKGDCCVHTANVCYFQPMKKTIALAAVCLYVITARAQDDVTMARYPEKPVVADGHTDEWRMPLNLFDNKTGFVFTVANDKENLYLCFTAREELKAERLMKAGWEIELSSSEKKRKFNATLVFPPVSDANISLNGEYRNQVSYYKMGLPAVQAKGFVTSNGEIPLQNAKGINIGIGSDNAQKLVYEIAIPLTELMEADKIQLNEVINLDITVNGIGKPAGQSAAARNFSAGKMGRMGGRRGGMQPAGPTDESASVFSKVGFRQKIKLVKD